MQWGDNAAVSTFLIILLYVVAASILLAFIYTLKSLRLQNRFKRLGSLRGRGVDEIVQFAGKPSHRGRLDGHREVLEWRRVGFHIALLFPDGHLILLHLWPPKLLRLIWARQGDYELESEVAVMRETASLSR